MASAPMGDEAGEKQKVLNYKVYTRKSFKNRAKKSTEEAVAVNSTDTGDKNSGGDGGGKGIIDNNSGAEKTQASPQTLASEEPNSLREEPISRPNDELDDSSSPTREQGANTGRQDSQLVTTCSVEQDVITSVQDSQRPVSPPSEVPEGSLTVEKEKEQGATIGIQDSQQPVGSSNEVQDNSLSPNREQHTTTHTQDPQQLDDCMTEVPDNSFSLNREQDTITRIQDNQQPVEHMHDAPSKSQSPERQQGTNGGMQGSQQLICRLGEVPGNSLSHSKRQVVTISTQNEGPDNSLGLSGQQGEITSIQDSHQQHGEGNLGPGDRVKINLASRTKQDLRRLRRMLEGELDVVRSLVRRIEAKEGEIVNVSAPHAFASLGLNNGSGASRPPSELASVSVHREARPLNRLSVPVMENIHGAAPVMEKEKRTPKANQFYRNSEFLLAKDKFPPSESNKRSKSNSRKQASGGDVGSGFGMGVKFFKSCSSLLEKLMKHKHGWVFNNPVDVEGLGLHDYYAIIKHPMDLGTIKSRLHKNWYKSPKEFAEDIRLTFNNAMTYNPKGHDVHIMAEQLLKIFEDRWAIIESDYNRQMRFEMDYESSLHTPVPRMVPPPRPPPIDTRRILDRSESMTQTVYQRPKSVSTTPSARTPAPKKPKAKDPHKRDMTFEEKQKLSANLQNLPSEKLDSIVQIIKKRSSAVLQQNDEIEVDIDRVDTETLWELDRFVTNYKKSLSKNKRKAERAIQARAEALQNVQEKNTQLVVADVPKEANTEVRNTLPSELAQGENQGGSRSSSSSSSSSSSDSGSSTSDSDSESSSSSVSIVGHSPRD